MLGGDFPKKRARCTTARSSAARSTARPRLTRPRSCMRKESSFTRCPYCRTSGTDQRPTSTWSWPMHHLRFFDARITQPTSLCDLYKSVNRSKGIDGRQRFDRQDTDGEYFPLALLRARRERPRRRAAEQGDELAAPHSRT